MGQAPALYYMTKLFIDIWRKKFDQNEIVTHKILLGKASDAYKILTTMKIIALKSY